MAEGRMLRKRASMDSRLAQLSAHSALLYVMSIPHLDADGRMDGDAVTVRGLIVPVFAREQPGQWTDGDVEAYMDEWGLTDPFPIVGRYELNGMAVCFFPGFHKNQKIRRDRESPSRFPAPPDHVLLQLGLADQFPDGQSSEDAIRESLLNRARAMTHRARKAGATVVEHVDLYAIGEAAQWICHLCRLPITKMVGRDSDSLSFDHVVSLREGGPHTTANIAPAHFGCNASKCHRRVTPGAKQEVKEEVSLTGLSVAHAREEVRSQGLQVAQELERSLASAAAASVTSGFASRPTGVMLPSDDELAKIFSGLSGADDGTLHQLKVWRRRGCGEREFAMARESLERRRQTGRELVNEARYFCSELSRLLSERAAA